MTVIKHSNGRYSVWSNVVDDFTVINITKEEYIIMRLEDYVQQLETEFENIDKDTNYGIFYTMNDRLNTIEMVHGKERRNETEKLLGGIK